MAHLCGALEFVADVSRWLIEQSINHGDMCTYAKATTTLAWTLASSQEAESLNEAQELANQAWQLLENTEIFNQIDAQNMDVIAIACELMLRIPIRFQLYGYQSLTRNDFEFLSGQSQLLMSKFKERHMLDPRLEKRYQIPFTISKRHILISSKGIFRGKKGV